MSSHANININNLSSFQLIPANEQEFIHDLSLIIQYTAFLTYSLPCVRFVLTTPAPSPSPLSLIHTLFPLYLYTLFVLVDRPYNDPSLILEWAPL